MSNRRQLLYILEDTRVQDLIRMALRQQDQFPEKDEEEILAQVRSTLVPREIQEQDSKWIQKDLEL